MDKVRIWGLPKEIPEDKAAVFRSRLLLAYDDIQTYLPSPTPTISIGEKVASTEQIGKLQKESSNVPAESNVRYIPQEPFYTFQQLVLPEDTMQEIKNAIELLKVESIVFDNWGLRKIEPNPRIALNFYGPPGTGKTLAAHAVASYLQKQILIASYAEIESKYHGDGPKNVKAVFSAAESEDAVLFIDEADSLLSRRLLNVSQGSEQAINSMRSQLLICLEQFHGTVIFATNLIENYDKAFETRIQHVAFQMPDASCRERIWKAHLPPELPLEPGLSFSYLAESIDDVCGRDIKNAVIRTAVQAALHNTNVTQQALLETVRRIKETRVSFSKEEQNVLNAEDKTLLIKKAKQTLQQNNSSPEEYHGR